MIWIMSQVNRFRPWSKLVGGGSSVIARHATEIGIDPVVTTTVVCRAALDASP